MGHGSMVSYWFPNPRQETQRMNGSLCIIALALLAPASSNSPIERSVAGYSISKSSRVAIRDSRTGYYLIRTAE